MYNVNMNPKDFVTDSFRLTTYKKLYEINIKPKPVKGIDQWGKIKHIPCLPPKERRMPGRPGIARKKDKSELRKHVAKAPKFITCKNCNQRGHNFSSCKNEKAPPVEKIPMKKGRPLVEDPINARVPGKRKRKAGPTNKPGPGKKGCAGPINQDGAADGVDEMANGEEVQVDGVDEMANGKEDKDDEDLVDIEDGGVDLQDDGVDLQDDGVDLQDDGVDLQDDGVDLQDDGVELRDDGHNIQPAVAPARVRTKRKSQRLVMRD
ncbi:hypothetical protein Tco_0755403 [Tanacetum coccineum]